MRVMSGAKYFEHRVKISNRSVKIRSSTVSGRVEKTDFEKNAFKITREEHTTQCGLFQERASNQIRNNKTGQPKKILDWHLRAF